jgi:hypothetical protein
MASSEGGGSEVLAIEGVVEMADVTIEEGERGPRLVANAGTHAGSVKGVGKAISGTAWLLEDAFMIVHKGGTRAGNHEVPREELDMAASISTPPIFIPWIRVLSPTDGSAPPKSAFLCRDRLLLLRVVLLLRRLFLREALLLDDELLLDSSLDEDESESEGESRRRCCLFLLPCPFFLAARLSFFFFFFFLGFFLVDASEDVEEPDSSSESDFLEEPFLEAREGSPPREAISVALLKGVRWGLPRSRQRSPSGLEAKISFSSRLGSAM